MKVGREDAPKMYARSRFVIVIFATVGDDCRTKSLYESRLLPFEVGEGEGTRVGDDVRVARLGDGEGLRGMQVGGAGQAEMLRSSLGRGARSTGGSAGV